MDTPTLQTLYRRCKLDEALEPGDERNVDFDDVAEDRRPRGNAWARSLQRIFVRELEPTHVLLTGLPGSGKSTELKRLEQGLREYSNPEVQRSFLPVHIDADDFIDLGDAIDVPELLLGIVHHVERQVLKEEGKNPDKAGKEGAFQRVWHFLSKTEVGLKELKIASPAPAVLGDLVFELKSQPSFRAQVRKAATSRLNAFCAQVRAEIAKLEARVQAHRNDPHCKLVIIVDSLEKLRGSTSTWDDVLSSAEQIFRDGAPYLQLPVHVLYTVPAALVARDVRDIQFMPMVKIYERDGQREFTPGIEALREMVRRRISDANLEELLGPHYEARIDQAIRWSAGYPRDLLRFLRGVLGKYEDGPVSERAWNRIRNTIFDDYRPQVRGNALDWLARLHVDKHLTPDDDDQRMAADRMMAANLVLHYCNEESWYDVHPAVLEMGPFKDAVEQLKRDRAPDNPDTP